MEILCENCQSKWLNDLKLQSGKLNATLEECPLCDRDPEGNDPLDEIFVKKHKPKKVKYHVKPGRQPAISKYTKEMLEWLRENRQSTTAIKLTPRFNKMFKLNVSVSMLKEIFRTYGIKKEKGPKHDKGLDPEVALKGDEFDEAAEDLELD